MSLQYHIQYHRRTNERSYYIHWDDATTTGHRANEVTEQRQTGTHKHRAWKQDPVLAGT